MNSRERILAAFDRKPVDRIPTDIWATPEAWGKLEQHFGSREKACAQLHIDFIDSITAKYIGPPPPPLPEGVTADYWGIQRKLTKHSGGTYEEECFHPLAFAESIDDLDKYAWPSTDWFDYSHLKEEALRIRETNAVKCGYMAPFFFHNLTRSLEQSLIDPMEDPEFAHEIIRRISDFLYHHHRCMFEACEGLIDLSEVTDDLGSQHGPLISPDLYNEFYAPHHQRFINLCHEFGIRVFHHDDGSCRAFLPKLIEMGIQVLNPIQWTCPGMELLDLKANFGDKICFHGGVENQRILPFGTTDEVRAEVRNCIDCLGSDGTGYVLAPCHNIQGNTPLENIIALYDEAWNYGKMA